MKNKYVSDGKLDLSMLRHDIVSLVMPLETVIDLSNSPSAHQLRPDILAIQAEIVKSLKALADALDKLPDTAQISLPNEEV